MHRRLLLILTIPILLAAACGNDDGADGRTDAGNGDELGDPGSATDGGDDESSGNRSDTDLVTLRLINLVGHTEGGAEVEVMGPAEDFASGGAVYATVEFGEIAEVQLPRMSDVTLRRTDNGESTDSHALFEDTPAGQVIVFTDNGATRLGADPDDRVDGYTTVGVVSAIHDPDDPTTAFVPTDASGTCLYGVSPGPSPDGYPTTFATPAEGGDTSSIGPLTLVSDRVYLAEPGAILVAWAFQDENPFDQGEDCSRRAFEAEVQGEDGKAVFVAFYGDVDDVQHSIWTE